MKDAPLARLRGLLTKTAASVSRLFGMVPRDGHFQRQRMCPFCGLITPRRERCCLECGRLLSPA